MGKCMPDSHTFVTRICSSVDDEVAVGTYWEPDEETPIRLFTRSSEGLEWQEVYLGIEDAKVLGHSLISASRQIQAVVHIAQSEINDLRETLRFYADEHMYDPDQDQHIPVARDTGDRARAALVSGDHSSPECGICNP